MEVELKYKNNKLSIGNFKHYANDENADNPYNTAFIVKVISDGFEGISEFECDYKDFIKFVNELKEMYSFFRDEVSLNDIGIGSNILFELNKKTGQIELSGILYGIAAEQSMKFVFNADQTVLKEFIDGITVLIR